MTGETSRKGRGRYGLALGAAAVAGVAGWMLVRGAARDEGRIAYQPIDTLKRLADDVWIVDSGPISAMGMKLPVRMTVIRLSDGGLLLHSPTRYTAELGRAVAELGTVRHLVAPTVAHWTYLGGWQRACPDATCHAVPALGKRAQVREAGIRIDADLDETVPQAWANDLEQGIVRGGGFEEVWFLHKASRTLLLADLIENLEPAKLTPMTAAVMRATFATSATTGLHVRAAVALGGQEARDAVRAMLATEPERVVFSHGDLFTGNVAARVRQAFAWLL